MPGRRLRQKPITMINVYQQARSSESADTYQKRSRMWTRLQDVLSSVPSRRVLLLGGDFNTTLRPAQNLVGQGVLEPVVVPQDQPDFQQLVQQHELCALNTWRQRRCAATFRDYSTAEGGAGVATQLDYLLVRSHHAGLEARMSTACQHVRLASWKHGARHLPVVACIPLPNYVTAQVRGPMGVQVDTEAMLHDAACNADRHQAFLGRVLTALEGQACPTWQALDTALKHASEAFYPKCRTVELRPWQEQPVQVALKHVWQARTTLRTGRNSVFLGLRILQFWRRVTNLRRTTKQLRQQSNAQRRLKWGRQLQAAEDALNRHDAHHFIQVITQLAPKQNRSRVQFRDEAGNVQSPAEELRTLHKFWSNVFHVPHVQHQQARLMHGLQFTESTVCQVLRAMQPRKAVYPGYASSAAWKVGADVVGPLLQRYLQQLFAPGLLTIPPQLTQAWLHFLPKPGKSNREPSHLRPIALQSIASKATSKLLRYHLQPFVDKLLLQCPQFAYTCNRGTTEAIARIVGHCNKVRAVLQGQTLDLHAEFAGVKRCECVGGAMLFLDFSRAYRLGSRRDAAQQMDIPATRGVKQGCMLAPTLWVLYTCFIFAKLDLAMHAGWTAEHVTAFADDLTFRWELHTLRDCEHFLANLDALLRVLESVGLQANPAKSSLLLEIRGNRGQAWLRKHMVRTGRPQERQFCYNLQHRKCLPLHKQCRYLGIVLAYDSYEEHTVKRRMAQAEAHRSRLRRVLQGRGGLSVRTRMRLWQVAIQTSQLYGLEATGVTETGLRQLRAQMMKHLRAIAREPRHVTRESDQTFLTKYHMPTVHQVLTSRCHGFVTRHAPGPVHSAVGVSCFDEHAIWLQARQIQMHVQTLQSNAGTRVQLIAVPEDAVIYKCQHCGMCFNNLHQVKTRGGRAHGVHAPQQTFDVTQRDSYSINGLPQCRFCRQKFTRWRNLQRHIQRNGCPALRSNDKDTVAAASQSEALPPSSVSSQMPTTWKSLSEVSAAGQLPLCRWPDVQTSAQRSDWRALLRLPDVQARAKQHCAICNQWVAQANGMRKRYRAMHAAYWEKWSQVAQTEAKLWSKAAVSPCAVMQASVSSWWRRCRLFSAAFCRRPMRSNARIGQTIRRKAQPASMPGHTRKAAPRRGRALRRRQPVSSHAASRHAGAAPGDVAGHGILPADGISSGGSHGLQEWRRKKQANPSILLCAFCCWRAWSKNSRAVPGAHCTDGGRGLAVPGLGRGDRQASPIFQAPDATCGDDGPDPHHQGGECSTLSVHPAVDGQLSG